MYFIKVTDFNDQTHILNISHIVSISPWMTEDEISASSIETISTSHFLRETPEEIESKLLAMGGTVK